MTLFLKKYKLVTKIAGFSNKLKWKGSSLGGATDTKSLWDYLYGTLFAVFWILWKKGILRFRIGAYQVSIS